MHNGQTPMTLADKKEHPVLLGRGVCCGGWISSISSAQIRLRFREKKQRFSATEIGIESANTGTAVPGSPLTARDTVNIKPLVK